MLDCPPQTEMGVHLHRSPISAASSAATGVTALSTMPDAATKAMAWPVAVGEGPSILIVGAG